MAYPMQIRRPYVLSALEVTGFGDDIQRAAFRLFENPGYVLADEADQEYLNAAEESDSDQDRRHPRHGDIGEQLEIQHVQSAGSSDACRQETEAHSDGEGLAVIRRNPRVRHPILLDVVLHEAEQFQTPYLRFGEPNHIDGIRFDQFGNPLYYELLREHPGSTSRSAWESAAEEIPSEFVLHWFKLRRPGQHRGVPECSSTLNVGAAARRWRPGRSRVRSRPATSWACSPSTIALPENDRLTRELRLPRGPLSRLRADDMHPSRSLGLRPIVGTIYRVGG